MSTLKCKVQRENLHVQLYFKKPLFKWQDTHVRFFEMIYAVLGERFNIQPHELSAHPSTVLAEVRARYSLYGGAANVTLWADRLVFDFPNLSASDMAIALEVLAKLHDAFPESFPQVELGKIEVQDYAHLDLGSPDIVEGFLRTFQIENVARTFGDDIPVINIPGIKFTVVSEKANWKCSVAIEKSELSSGSIFATASTTILKLSLEQPYLEKAALVREITNRCLRAVNLEVDDGSAT